jgi:hypothetical protein
MAGVQIMSTQALLTVAGGGGGGSVNISDHTLNKIGNGSSTAVASISYNSSGTTTSHTGATLETWLVSGAAGDFEIRATLQSGSTPSTGTMDTWQALSTSRAWTLDILIGDTDTSTFLIEIRDATSLAVLDSASITLKGNNTGTL